MLKQAMLAATMIGLLVACGPTPDSEQADGVVAPSQASQQPESDMQILLSPSPTLPQVTIPIAAPVLGDTWRRPNDDMQMVFIPAGNFQMGSMESNPCAHLDELPQHTVYLDAYWIDQHEVTNAQYRKCVEAGWCTEPTCSYGTSTYMDETKEDHPVGCVDWYEASAYCEWSGGQLPTEAQWEKAARGTEAREYPWGAEFDAALCNSSESAIGGSTPVGLYSPDGDSPYGLADVSGNLWEWVTDWYDIGYYAQSPSSNPTGPQGGENRAARGGSWYGNYCSVRTTYRYYNTPHGRSPGMGFRCVLDQ
jgi:formylglycine-generating enzyme required for sulfatase activity